MKVIQVSFDTTTITTIIDVDINLIDVLIEEDDNFEEIENKIYYKFSDDYIEECMIEDVTNKRGIIQFESH